MDWNGDGHRDMLVGGFGGDVTYYAGKPDGTFAAGTELRFGNGEYFLHKPILSEYMKEKFPESSQQGMLAQDDSAAGIWVTDWDGDGDLDIVSGWFFGGLFVSRNNGTSTEPKLSEEFEPIYAGGQPLTEVFQAEPCIADWDGDGREDLIYGMRSYLKTNEGAVYWCRNTSDKGDPVYSAPEKLIDAGSESQLMAPWLGHTRQFGAALTVSTIDWDGDGDLDLLVGDYATEQTVLEGVTEAQFQHLSSLKRQSAKLMGQLRDTADEGARKSLMEQLGANQAEQGKYLPPRGPRVPKSERPPLGRVWLLIRE